MPLLWLLRRLREEESPLTRFWLGIDARSGDRSQKQHVLFRSFVQLRSLSGRALFTGLCEAIDDQMVVVRWYADAQSKENRQLLKSNYAFQNKKQINAYQCLNHTKNIIMLQKADKVYRLKDYQVHVGISSSLFKRVALSAIEAFG